MNVLNVMYWWVNQKKFLRNFSEDETKLQQARRFWKSLEETDLWVWIVIILLTSIVCIYYYTWFNNTCRPFGYHYRRRYWAGTLLIWWVLLFVCICCIDQFVLYVGLSGSNDILWTRRVSAIGWSTCIYILLSIIWCSCLPTNAYRWFKFK